MSDNQLTSIKKGVLADLNPMLYNGEKMLPLVSQQFCIIRYNQDTNSES